MICYIDHNRRTHDMFWKEVQILLSPQQRIRLLDGEVIHACGREFQVITDEAIEEMIKKDQPLPQ